MFAGRTSSVVESFHDFVWISHSERVWDLVRILRRDVSPDGINTLQVNSVTYTDEGIITIPETNAFAYDLSHSAQLDDLCDMNNLHEAPLLDTLEKRAESDVIYTSASNILISINPYRNIPGLFDNPMEFYTPAAPDSNVIKLGRPHVYTVANKVLSSLVNAGPEDIKNQSVVISGESGSGKTEASKYVMRFLIAVNDACLKNPSSSSEDIGARIRDVLVDTNVVLEAFGNAKTVRNDNSSRFGKYTKLQYNDSNELRSAHTQTFLLEKSRLTTVGEQERNYHVLYQITKGSDSSLDKARLYLHDVNAFKILTSGNCLIAGAEDRDSELFTELCSALRTLGTSEVEMTCLWDLLAAILHLGNITVSSRAEADLESELHALTMPLEGIASLLGTTALSLKQSLLYHVVKVDKRASVSMKSLSAEETANNINGLMKWLYSGIFNWLVLKLNGAYGFSRAAENSGQGVTKFIGILDIFGFETLLNNSFEQLCINFANERLQQQFNEQVFVFEQIEYEREGLNWNSVTFRDNQPVIDLISKKPSGLLHVLEEHGMMNRKPDDVALLQAYGQFHYQKHPAYAKPRFGSESFIVKHFAGDVTYNVIGFLSKNNDSLQDDLLELMKTSENSFLLNAMALQRIESSPGFVPDNYDVVETVTAGGNAAAMPRSTVGGQGKKMASAITVSYQFRQQLDDLVSTLRATKPHYIKCLKPNGNKSATEFSPALVMEQLRYSGILEVVRIRREGYPARITFRDFYNKYYLLGMLQGLPRPVRCSSCSDEEIRGMAGQIAEIVFPTEPGSTEMHYQLGHNKVFMRDGGLNSMSRALSKFKRKYCLKIQSWLRCKQASQHYRASRIGAVQFQKYVRRYINMKKYQRNRIAALMIVRFSAREFFRRKAVRCVEVLRQEEAARRKAAAELAEKLRLEEEARRAEEEERARLTASLKIQIWSSCRTRQRFTRRKYAVTLRSIRLIQGRIRILLAKKRKILLQKQKFAGAVRAITAFGLISRSNMQQRRIKSIVQMIVLDEAEQLFKHFEKFPKDEHLVYRLPVSSEFRPLLQMICFLGSTQVMTRLNPKRAELMKLDHNGRNCLHHWAMGPHPSIQFATELLDRCKGAIAGSRGSVAKNLSFETKASPSSLIKEGWLRKKRPGNKFEKRWVTLEAISGGVKLSYFKGKGDKASKGEIVMMKSEEALTVRRVPIEETTGAKDELFQFEIFSPVGLSHKSKSPVMLFNAETEMELQEWLAPVRHAVGRTRDSNASPTKELSRETTGVRMSTDDRASTSSWEFGAGSNMRFRANLCSEPDSTGNTPLHMLCASHSCDDLLDSSLRSLYSDAGVNLLPSHFLSQSKFHRMLQKCVVALWMAANCGIVVSFDSQTRNDANQNFLHLAGRNKNFILGEAIESLFENSFLYAPSHDADAALIASFLSGEDDNGHTPLDYFRSSNGAPAFSPLDISDIKFEDVGSIDSRLSWLDVPAAINRVASMLSRRGKPVSPLALYGGFTYQTIHFFTLEFQRQSAAELIKSAVSRSSSKYDLKLAITIRSTSGKGHWLCTCSSFDYIQSVMTVMDSVSGREEDNRLRVLFGHTWVLSVPLQNLDAEARTIIEVTRVDDNSPVCWTYLSISPNSSTGGLPLGISELNFLPGGCPIALSAESPPSSISFPPLPTAVEGSIALNAELSQQRSRTR